MRFLLKLLILKCLKKRSVNLFLNVLKGSLIKGNEVREI